MDFIKKSIAERVLKKYWNQGTLPIDPVYIAKAYNISVYSSDITYDGVFDSKTNTIIINEQLSFIRARYIIAHELGHALMKHKSIPDNASMFCMPNKSQIEIEANIFAIELLMPEIDLRALIEVRQVYNIERLAFYYFYVSEEAMRYRLSQLHYL